MTTEEEYTVLYTGQKTKKAKTWHDGTLKVLSSGTKAVLYDDNKSRIDSVYVRATDIVIGEQIESDRYLILIEEKKSTPVGATPASCDQTVGLKGHPPGLKDQPAAGHLVRSGLAGVGCRGGGLKRKRTGFVPPRMLPSAQQVPPESDAAPAQPTSPGSVNHLQGFTSYQASRARLYCRQQAPALTPQGQGSKFEGLQELDSRKRLQSEDVGKSHHQQSRSSISELRSQLGVEGGKMTKLFSSYQSSSCEYQQKDSELYSHNRLQLQSDNDRMIKPICRSPHQFIGNVQQNNTQTSDSGLLRSGNSKLMRLFSHNLQNKTETVNSCVQKSNSDGLRFPTRKVTGESPDLLVSLPSTEDDTSVSPQLTSFLSKLKSGSRANEGSPGTLGIKSPWTTFGSSKSTFSPSLSDLSSQNSDDCPYVNPVSSSSNDNSLTGRLSDQCKDTKRDVSSIGSEEKENINCSLPRQSSDSENTGVKRTPNQILALLKKKSSTTATADKQLDRIGPSVTKALSNHDQCDKLPENTSYPETSYRLDDHKPTKITIKSAEDDPVVSLIHRQTSSISDLDQERVPIRSPDPEEGPNIKVSKENELTGEEETEDALDPFNTSDATFEINFSPLSHVSSSDEELENLSVMKSDGQDGRINMNIMRQNDQSEAKKLENSSPPSTCMENICENEAQYSVESLVDFSDKKACKQDSCEDNHFEKIATITLPGASGISQEQFGKPMVTAELPSSFCSEQSEGGNMDKENILTDQGALNPTSINGKEETLCSQPDEQKFNVWKPTAKLNSEKEAVHESLNVDSFQTKLYQTPGTPLICMSTQLTKTNSLPSSQTLTLTMASTGTLKEDNGNCSSPTKILLHDDTKTGFITHHDPQVPSPANPVILKEEGNQLDTKQQLCSSLQTPCALESTVTSSKEGIHCPITNEQTLSMTNSNPLNHLQLSPESFDFNSSLSQLSQSGFLGTLNAAASNKCLGVSLKAGSAFDDSPKIVRNLANSEEKLRENEPDIVSLNRIPQKEMTKVLDSSQDSDIYQNNFLYEKIKKSFHREMTENISVHCDSDSSKSNKVKNHCEASAEGSLLSGNIISPLSSIISSELQEEMSTDEVEDGFTQELMSVPFPDTPNVHKIDAESAENSPVIKPSHISSQSQSAALPVFGMSSINPMSQSSGESAISLDEHFKSTAPSADIESSTRREYLTSDSLIQVPVITGQSQVLKSLGHSSGGSAGCPEEVCDVKNEQLHEKTLSNLPHPSQLWGEGTKECAIKEEAKEEKNISEVVAQHLEQYTLTGMVASNVVRRSDTFSVQQDVVGRATRCIDGLPVSSSQAGGRATRNNQQISSQYQQAIDKRIQNKSPDGHWMRPNSAFSRNSRPFANTQLGQTESRNSRDDWTTSNNPVRDCFGELNFESNTLNSAEYSDDLSAKEMLRNDESSCQNYTDVFDALSAKYMLEKDEACLQEHQDKAESPPVGHLLDTDSPQVPGMLKDVNSEAAWVVFDSQSSSSAGGSVVGEIPLSSRRLQQESLHRLQTDSSSQEDTDENFYVDWNNGKPKFAPKPFKHTGARQTKSASQTVPVSDRQLSSGPAVLGTGGLQTVPKFTISSQLNTPYDTLNQTPFDRQNDTKLLKSRPVRRPLKTDPEEELSFSLKDTNLETFSDTNIANPGENSSNEHYSCGDESFSDWSLLDNSVCDRFEQALQPSQLREPLNVTEKLDNGRNRMHKVAGNHFCPSMPSNDSLPAMELDQGRNGKTTSTLSQFNLSEPKQRGLLGRHPNRTNIMSPFDPSASSLLGHPSSDLEPEHDQEGPQSGCYKYRGSARWQLNQSGEEHMNREQDKENRGEPHRLQWGRYLKQKMSTQGGPGEEDVGNSKWGKFLKTDEGQPLTAHQHETQRSSLDQHGRFVSNASDLKTSMDQDLGAHQERFPGAAQGSVHCNFEPQNDDCDRNGGYIKGKTQDATVPNRQKVGSFDPGLDSNCDNFFGGTKVTNLPLQNNQTTGQKDHVCIIDDVDFDDSFDDGILNDQTSQDLKTHRNHPSTSQHSVTCRHSPNSCGKSQEVSQSINKVKTISSKFTKPRFVNASTSLENSAPGLNLRMNPPLNERTTLEDSEGLSSAKPGQFKTPVIKNFSSSVLHSSKTNLCGELQFPSSGEVESNVTPARQVTIPVSFPSVQDYKQTIAAALREHLNIILFDLSRQFHRGLDKVDVSGFSGHDKSTRSKGSKSSNPPCKCGTPSKMVQVRKDGPNKGRFFYACEAPRNQQCKFFQWMDQPATKVGKPGDTTVSRASLHSADSITAYIRGNGVMFYCECQLLFKHRDNFNQSKFKKGIPAWVRRQQEQLKAPKKCMYIRLSKRDTSSYYSRDDVWVVSQSLMFEPGSTFIAKSCYFGPNSNNEVEIEPISGYSPSNWSNNCDCHAILVGNASMELVCLVNLEEFVNISSLPILPHLLNRRTAEEKRVQMNKSTTKLCTPGHFVTQLAEDYVLRYRLNMDQAVALMRVAAMMNKDEENSDPVMLIHGVFGAGKSFLLSVLIRFLVDVFQKNDTYTPDVPYPWKLLISSTTNVAVDRVLTGLLDLGFEDFIRVGSVKKIAKPVLPYSVHVSGSDSQELKDLQEMLRSDIPPSEKQLVRKSIEKHRLGENKKKLGGVRVVGVTCAACSFNCLNNIHFPFVVLDECSQMTEPASMLPIARFRCEKLVLVGDPKQLDPTIQGSEPGHREGLEQTLFDRMTKLEYSPVFLRTQYRCHPWISHISNSLFYNGQLQDGVSLEDRPPLTPMFPTLCFYDVSSGEEATDGSGSYYNTAEAHLVVKLIHGLVLEGVEARCVGVITLYKAQMYKIITSLHTNDPCMNKELKAVQVSTVDAFQGGERDVIILSCVRSNNFGFIDNDKRTNVALTRARHHLLIVGHQRNLSRNKLWSQVIQNCRDRPMGVQCSRSILAELQALIKARRATEASSLETNSGQTKKRAGKRKRRKKNEDSPPMSLSGETVSSGASVDIISQGTDKHSTPEETGTAVELSMDDDFVSDKPTRHEETRQVRKRQRRSELLDPSVFMAGYSDSDEDDLPTFV